MAVDASGTPTTKFSIPKFNVNADAPSGLGSNAQMDSIDALIANLGIAGLVANDVPIFDSVAGKFKKATGTPSSSTFLRGDGSWAAVGSTVTASLWSGGPPGSPSNGDIWIGTAVDTGDLTTTLGIHWAFRYNSSHAASDKWEWAFGTPLRFEYAPGGAAFNNGAFTALGGTGWLYLNTTTLKYTTTRAGDYIFEARMGHHTTGVVQSSLAIANISAVSVPLGYSRDDFSTTAAGFGPLNARPVRVAGLAAGIALAPAWSSSNTAASIIDSVYFEVHPLRIT